MPRRWIALVCAAATPHAVAQSISPELAVLGMKIDSAVAVGNAAGRAAATPYQAELDRAILAGDVSAAKAASAAHARAYFSAARPVIYAYFRLPVPDNPALNACFAAHEPEFAAVIESGSTAAAAAVGASVTRTCIAAAAVGAGMAQGATK